MLHATAFSYAALGRTYRRLNRLDEAKATLDQALARKLDGGSLRQFTLKQALAVELGQSPFLNVLSDRKVSETLQMMGRTANQRITADVSRDLCLRTGSKAVLNGTISSLGSHYLIDAARSEACW